MVYYRGASGYASYKFIYSIWLIKDTPTRVSPICLYREAICLLFYVHAHVKKGNTLLHAHITLMTFTRLTQNSIVGSILALYGSAMHIATLMPYFQAR